MICCVTGNRPEKFPFERIENDFKYEKESLPVVDVEKATKEELVAAIKEAGIIGLADSIL